MDPAQFVRGAVVKKDVLGSRPGVAEAPADIETEPFPVEPTAAATPVPAVTERPDPPAPVKQAEGAIGRKEIFPAVDHGGTLCGHTVDFMVVVKTPSSLVKGRGHDDRGFIGAKSVTAISMLQPFLPPAQQVKMRLSPPASKLIEFLIQTTGLPLRRCGASSAG